MRIAAQIAIKRLEFVYFRIVLVVVMNRSVRSGCSLIIVVELVVR